MQGDILIRCSHIIKLIPFSCYKQISHSGGILLAHINQRISHSLQQSHTGVFISVEDLFLKMFF